MWLKVKAWRDLAHNIAASVHVGEPVVVVGRLRTQTYTAGGEEKHYQELEASMVGHDLSKGTSMFRRSRASGRESGDRSQAELHEQPSAPAGENAAPVPDGSGPVEVPAGAA